MAARNRVTPLGDIVAIEQRGTFLGNRGCIHEGGSVVRPWRGRRWITCRLSYRGWVAPAWEAGRWTPLFFWDEAVALAAGHRPCARCRRPDHRRWLDAWETATGDRPRAGDLDLTLHADRRTAARDQRHHRRPWGALPTGAFVLADGGPALVAGDALVPWRPDPQGYGLPRPRPCSGVALVLTPSVTVEVLVAGYRPALHPSAGNS